MNARDDSNIRNENVRCIKQLGYKEWSKLKGYCKRYSRIVYSSFKRIFNKYCLSTSTNSKELKGKGMDIQYAC